MVSEPARFAEKLLGTFTTGYRLDDAVARDLALVTHCDVTFVCDRQPPVRQQPAGVRARRPRRSPHRVQPGLRLARRRARAGARPDRRRAGPARDWRDAVCRRRLLARGGRACRVRADLLQQDWAPTQAFLDELRVSLLLAGVGGFVIALAGGLVFSHRTSQPLMDLAAAAREIAAGDWSRIVAARGSAESTTMAMAFNDMTRSLRSQAER